MTADSPLGRGMLTGTIRSTSDIDKKDFRSMAPRFQREALAKVRKAAELQLGLLCCCQRALGYRQEALDKVSHVNGNFQLGW